MAGYLFTATERNAYVAGRVVAKTGSMVEKPRGVGFSYRFSGDTLFLYDVQSWDDPEWSTQCGSCIVAVVSDSPLASVPIGLAPQQPKRAERTS